MRLASGLEYISLVSAMEYTALQNSSLFLLLREKDRSSKKK